MSPEQDTVEALRAFWVAEPCEQSGTDYTLLAEIGGGYAAHTRAGLPALVLPMKEIGPGAVGRRASGCELLGHASTRFVIEGRDTVGPAAALVCIDAELADVFAVLAIDVAKRMREGDGSWSSILAAVEEWQTLLAPRGRPNAEAELGLWGELWFLAQADDIDTMLAGWRGPDRDVTDFFVRGKGAEVKTSRYRRQHHVSLTQVDEPVGTHEAWLLSIWVKVDPGAQSTVVHLAEEILNRARDRGGTLRRLARAGYSPAERSGYTSAFVVLAEPEWYAAAAVPRVRVADPGVSHVRYSVALDEARRADNGISESIWRHFHGHEYGGERK